jgi:hypothetical protein
MEKEHVKLTDEDRKTLNALLVKGSLKARIFKRATGLLELDRGKTLEAVAATLAVITTRSPNGGTATKRATCRAPYMTSRAPGARS